MSSRPADSLFFFFFVFFLSFFLSFLFCCWISWARSVFYTYIRREREREREIPLEPKEIHICMYICIDHGGKSHKNKSFIAPGDFPSLSLWLCTGKLCCVCVLVGRFHSFCVAVSALCVCVEGKCFSTHHHRPFSDPI